MEQGKDALQLLYSFFKETEGWKLEVCDAV
jgi:hypothetical protein